MKGRLIFLSVFVLITGILTAQNFITGKNEVPVFHPDSADFVVAQDGSGDFITVQAAIDAVPAYRKKRTTIFIKNGIYKEKPVVPANKQLVSFIGENAEKTILTYGDWAPK